MSNLSLNTEQKNILHPFAKISYSVLAVAKSIAEPENSNNLYTANDSTPLTRAFFVRSLRTPKINLVAQIERLKFNLSMVERNGKGSPFAVFRVSQFLSPLRSTAQPLRSLAVVPKNFYTELSQMFYKFLFIGSRLHITVYARNLAEAYTRLPLSQTKPILIARLPVV